MDETLSSILRQQMPQADEEMAMSILEAMLMDMAASQVEPLIDLLSPDPPSSRKESPVEILQRYFSGDSNATPSYETPAAVNVQNIAANGIIASTEGADVSEVQYDLNWLRSRCLRGDADSDFMAQSIYNVLSGNGSDDHIQELLVQLLGYDDFDFLMQLIAQRQVIVQTIRKSMEASATTNEGIATLVQSPEDSVRNSPVPISKAEVARIREAAKEPQRPTIGVQFTVQTEQEKRMLKEQRKADKKLRKVINKLNDLDQDDVDVAELQDIRDQMLEANAQQPLFSSQTKITERQKYPFVFDRASARQEGGVMLTGYGHKFSLPAGAERRDTTTYEKVSIPIADYAARGDPYNIQLVGIDRLEPWVQPIFKGYTSLNRMQSVIFPTAYSTNENMLVCAPTGAGKTDVAMLAVLSTIRAFMDLTEDPANPNEPPSLFLRKNDFKIVYVAPMKALAAEIVRKFEKRLQSLGIAVRELTGDMQLTKAEILATQMIVTTPEKWDVITRKATGDVELSMKVRLLIVDEVHLLHDDRGSVLESIIARTLRQVESSQTMIRIVGLSATLPNYVDVAEFLKVNPLKGLFYFDGSFRPVPLAQQFFGVKGKSNSFQIRERMDQVMFDSLLPVLEAGRQAMVFVHARKETVNTGFTIKELALAGALAGLFQPDDDLKATMLYQQLMRDVQRSRNRELKELVAFGVGTHNAGMLRSDRTLVERLFESRIIKVLVCTATLAWGVNLPAHAVIIKGTQVYDPMKGAFIDLSILDVLQIFGRAGRPQFETHGLGIIITTHDKLAHYIVHMASQLPIESTFSEHLADNLNAEISATGTVTNLDEAVQWLGYTYFFIRMRKNPLVYGLRGWDLTLDPNLVQHRRDLCISTAKSLVKSQMINFDELTGIFTAKDLGRISSSYYLRKDSVEVFNESLNANCAEADVLGIVSCSHEFDGIKVRDEEITEMKKLVEKGACPCEMKLGPEHVSGKINVLLQAYISRAPLESFALISESAYVAQNAPRILRALFEVTLKRKWAPCTAVLLSLCKSVEKQMWSFEHPLMQFSVLSPSKSGGKDRKQSALIPLEIIRKLDQLPGATTDWYTMRDMNVEELANLIRNNKVAPVVYRCLRWIPDLEISSRVLPITRTVVRVEVSITPNFTWNDKVHGSSDPWWIWIEDSQSIEIYAHEYFIVQRGQIGTTHKLGFIVPVSEPVPQQLYIRAISDRWIGSEVIQPVSFRHLIMPESASPYTELLDLMPLNLSALRDPLLEGLYRDRFSHFNPVQTQVFHSLYHTDHNVLIGAPTSSGKTLIAELAMFRAFRTQPKSTVVYIAPLKALVRERLLDWRKKLHMIGKVAVEMTGDSVPDQTTLRKNVDVIITTPEKWDGLSRNWRQRKYISGVSLVIIDEIHLLGTDRGPILEVIVSRMNYISFHTGRKIRIVGLSTALANAKDLADWLNVHPTAGLFNFRHSVRPVPLEVHIDGFSGRHYCPRMATMNKPIFQSILMHSPTKPVIVFVSSRRQTRLTAKDLMALCATTASNMQDAKRFLHMPESDVEHICQNQVRDQQLRLCLEFGIGLHHAGLTDGDRRIVEELFVNQKIQILIATSTVAWGVNYPAHLVIVKGTEFYDAKSKRYVDFPVTDVLQMMGRAGRPQFDQTGIAHIMVHDVKKSFYKRFLHEPFPVESALHEPHNLYDHINAEVAGGTIRSKQDAVDYLTWTYFYRRLRMNPTFYGLIPESLRDDISDEEENEVTEHRDPLEAVSRYKGCIPGHAHLTEKDVVHYLEDIVSTALTELEKSFCLEVDGMSVCSSALGEVASFYYLQHRSIRLFREAITDRLSMEEVLDILSRAMEFEELPVRHNEELMNADLAQSLNDRFNFGQCSGNFHSPHTKTLLLLKAHLCRYDVADLPIADYYTDTKSVLDQAVRVIQGMIDVAAAHIGKADPVLRMIETVQCIKSGCRWTENALMGTHVFASIEQAATLLKYGVETLPDLLHLKVAERQSTLSALLRSANIDNSDFGASALLYYPLCEVQFVVENVTPGQSLRVSTEYTVLVTVIVQRRGSFPMKESGGSSQIQGSRAYTPRFWKPQPEGWFLLLGNESNDHLVALKRYSLKDNDATTVSLKFKTDSSPGSYRLKLWLMSDCYMGLDQEYQFHIEVQ